MTRTPSRRAPSATAAGAPAPLTLSRDSQLAAEIKGLVIGGDRDAARERYGELVAHQQRRAVRIAYQYLRDAHDADEAVQDAFIKVFTHITSYREELPFEVWFTRSPYVPRAGAARRASARPAAATRTRSPAPAA